MGAIRFVSGEAVGTKVECTPAPPEGKGGEAGAPQTAHSTPAQRCEEMARGGDSPLALLATLNEQVRSLLRRAEAAENEVSSLQEALEIARTAGEGLGRDFSELRARHAEMEKRCAELEAALAARDVDEGRLHAIEAERDDALRALAAAREEVDALKARVQELTEEQQRTAVEMKVLAQRAERAVKLEAEASAALEEKRMAEAALARVASCLRDALLSHERAVGGIESALRAALGRDS